MIDEILKNAIGEKLQCNEPMSRHTTLRVGGPARWYWAADNVEDLSRVLSVCAKNDIPYLFIGHGSNLLMSDKGYNGLVIRNKCKNVSLGDDICVESGASFGALFLKTAKAGYSGLEWAVGIPGTVGGALVSNAGAYRGNIGPLVKSIRIFHDGTDQVVGPEWMEFSYRDSRLRRTGIGRTVILTCTLMLRAGCDPEEIMERAKSYQAQRRAKQPLAPSAGSFFKNINDHALAQSLPNLPDNLRAAGVVPSGYLIEAVGLKGLRVGGAEVSAKHANFLINANFATAADFFELALKIKTEIFARFNVKLEEEVLYVGDWEQF